MASHVENFSLLPKLSACWISSTVYMRCITQPYSAPFHWPLTHTSSHHYKDLCLIFFCLFLLQDMTSAVITPCSHLFHAGCLKKWLYVQEACPLCHSQLKSAGQKDPGTDTSSQPDTSNHDTQPVAPPQAPTSAETADSHEGEGEVTSSTKSELFPSSSTG